jgi:hypothetical protein
MDGDALDELEQLRNRLDALRSAHEALGAEVELLTAEASTDQLRLARLKKQKLFLKDQIARLENLLMPDLIA